MKNRVLFLCTANSARSQMGEGLLPALAGDRIEVSSAGAQPSTVNPLAIKVMAERGLDIRHHRSKHLGEFLTEPFDYVITLCNSAAESCPLFSGPAKRIHWDLPDPAAVEGSEERRLASFRQVRNDLEARLKAWLETVPL
jgi:arsenate reductase